MFDVASGDVAQDADGGDEQSHGWFLQVSDDTWDHSTLHHQLYLVLVGIRVVGNGPTTISDNLLIVQFAIGDSMTQDGDGMPHIFVFGKWTTPAKIG